MTGNNMYTKGEWKAYIFEKSGIVHIVEQTDQRIIADLPTKSLAWDDIKANAQLIASAPDLYEACKLVDRAWVGDGVDMSLAVDAVLLALAKAEVKK